MGRSAKSWTEDDSSPAAVFVTALWSFFQHVSCHCHVLDFHVNVGFSVFNGYAWYLHCILIQCMYNVLDDIAVIQCRGLTRAKFLLATTLVEWYHNASICWWLLYIIEEQEPENRRRPPYCPDLGCQAPFWRIWAAERPKRGSLKTPAVLPVVQIWAGPLSGQKGVQRLDNHHGEHSQWWPSWSSWPPPPPPPSSSSSSSSSPSSSSSSRSMHVRVQEKISWRSICVQLQEKI